MQEHRFKGKSRGYSTPGNWQGGNVGAQHGVVVGMIFDVLDPKGEDIPDPDSGELLGSIRRPKVQVKIIQVDDRVSLASTFRSWKVNVGGQSSLSVVGFAKLFEPPQWVTQYETFKAHEKGWDDIAEQDSFVKVGDPVVQVLGDTAEADTSAKVGGNAE